MFEFLDPIQRWIEPIFQAVVGIAAIKYVVWSW